MMFYLSKLSQHFGPLRVFEYSTFRGIAAAFTAFLISVLFGKLRHSQTDLLEVRPTGPNP